MSRVVVTDALRSVLPDLSQPHELCDESGRILARLVPVLDPVRWEPASPDVSEEELDRRAKSNQKRYTTAQVLEHLEKL